MEWCSVSFIFHLIAENDTDRIILLEEYYLFSFNDRSELETKIDNCRQVFQNKNITISYRGRTYKKEFLGTRGWYSTFNPKSIDDDLVDFTELAYSIMSANSIENAKKVAQGKSAEINYEY